MAKKRSSDPAMRELERELQANTQALKDAYLRFDYVCDNDLVESCIFEINALKARSNYLLRQIKAELDLPVRCLMRPRAGDFLYTRDELELLCRQIETLRSAGADGFVIGALTPEGALDLPAMRTLLNACGGAPVTLHRCIDVSRDLCATYRAAAALGIDTVLTSGGAGSCRKGISQLAALLRLRDELDGPEVLIGAGVNAAVIDELRAALPGARAFHTSCKTLLESGMTFRREGVPMGLPGLDEWHIQQTDADAVRAVKAAVMR